MLEKTEKTTPFFVKVAEFPLVQGPVLGAGVLALVTPLLKWTNHAYKGEKMPRGNYFAGAKANALSAGPAYAATFGFKALLGKSPEETSELYELLSSFAAGGLSGLAGTSFEAVAQNQQLTHSTSPQETARQMYRHHGYGAFFQGAGAVMLREGAWSTVYMTAIPMMSAGLQKQGVDKQLADLVSMLAVAGSYGVLSSPLNQLRFRKQAGLTEPGQSKSYWEHTKDVFNQDPKASTMTRVGSFFKAALPRAATTVFAAGLIVKGTELYNQAVDYCKPS